MQESEATMSKVYFYDNDNKYIGARRLMENEKKPLNSTETYPIIKIKEQAHFISEKWVVSEIPIQQTIEDKPQEKTIEQQIEEMALQLINAQEALDFLIMGGM